MFEKLQTGEKIHDAPRQGEKSMIHQDVCRQVKESSSSAPLSLNSPKKHLKWSDESIKQAIEAIQKDLALSEQLKYIKFLEQLCKIEFG